MLNREVLESKLPQQLLANPELSLKILSDEELLASIKATLEQNSTNELWIFAYGSLIWNPLFDYLERCVVTLEGWQRQFCLLVPVGRGTIENPGLVLGLEPGDRCQGIAYRIAVDDNLEAELLLLWRREMIVGSYIPTWLTAKNGSREISVLTFIVNSQHRAYVNHLSREEIVTSLATAKGFLGSSAEYLSHTVQGLLAEGIEDQQLIELDHLVKHQQRQFNQDLS
ncbi:MAG: gamma-glutamylcyclotransferase [Pleurocapsa sp. MO_192.B19]|nr:gamma-glutamylcyclotransferase [Pleurocapsa sp. MO_192.B19]